MRLIYDYFRTPSGPPLLRIGLLVVSLVLVVTNALHIRSTELGDPYGVRVDFALVLTSFFLKWIVLIGCLIMFRAWFESIYGRPKQAVLGILALGIPLILLTLFIAENRAQLASRLSNSSEKYHSFESDTDEFALQDANYSRVRWYWQNGITQLLECTIAILIVAVLAAFGVIGGRDLWGLPIVMVPGALLLYWIIFRLFVIDFDLFHGDIWSGAMLIDLVWLFPSDPYAMIASLYYATFTTGLSIVTWRMQTTPEGSVSAYANTI